ncbi:TPA: hypothetical protein VJI18_003992 [Salmonella enterica subsp. salamae serovar 48:z:e,n,x,z15]|nr:hypothetical protein [Salmonella enterica subsp. salamae]EEF0863333.1 hypothetical protein [Salmonella enterica subsp. salamae]HDC1420435.1 hypothetical protein [Salmonella enterica]HER1247987.1 hypothetical protein [Salmonella enterica subsp. salamae serovar 48:z:e,n,x,z15]
MARVQFKHHHHPD